jgi:tRNA dimethylallyltransferase
MAVDHPLVAVVGPTGSGKSSLALRLAREFGGEIVGCDSLQIYRGFDIGSAKVPVSGREGIPHHLIDIAEPGEVFTAGDYARRARAVLQEIAGRGRLPIVAGGTGFYLRALLEGLSPGPGRDEAVRARLDKRTDRRLHRLLRRLDPAAAARIHPADRPKMIRALEVRVLERRPLSELQALPRRSLRGFAVRKLGLDPPRAELRARIDARTAEMFRQGLVAEVRGLLAAGCSGTEKPFQSLGYAQALAVARGQLGESEAVAAAQAGTRQYAKRQMTWFRREQNIQWLSGFGHCAELQLGTIETIREWLEQFRKVA